MILGTKCRWLVPETTSYMTKDACLGCASTGKNPCGIPLSMVRLMLRDRDPQVVQCSATMLDGCAREHGIKKAEGWYVNPDYSWARSFGSLMHAGNEFLHGQDPLMDREVRYSRPYSLDGKTVTITAQVDSIYFSDDGKSAIIRDLKLVDSLSNSALDRKLESHRVQFSIQRWILQAHDIEISSIDLDFMCHKGKRNVNLYPEGDPELVYASLLSIEETEAYLQRRLPDLVASLEGQLAPPLSDPRQFWRCRRCDVQEQCEAMYGRPLPATG